MKFSLKAWLPMLVFVVLVAFFALGLGLNPRELPSPLVGQPAPAFSLPLLNAPERSMGPEQLRGREWLLNVWASWCVACAQEHPVLVAFAREKTLPIVGLNYKDKTEDARAWLQRLGDPYAWNAADLDGRVGIDYGVYGAPETFLIDAEGVIRHKYIGPLSAQIIRDDLLPRLAQLRQEAP